MNMASKAITVGVGIPMIIVGALMAWLWAPIEGDYQNQVELIWKYYWNPRSSVLYLWIVFYTKEPVMH